MPGRQPVSAIVDTRGQAAFWVPSLLRIAVVAACVALGACTTVGVHTRQRLAVAYGPPVQMRVCVLRAPGVSPQRVDALVAAVNSAFAAYGIEVIVPWMRPWPRPGFTFQRLFDDLARRALEAPCDRLMAFGDRHVGDFLWGLTMPEVLGAVDDDTHTRGYVVATRVSLNQLITPPAAVTVHEFYHLLGCRHAASMSDCYGRIAALKRSYDPRTDFFPGVGRDARFLLTRHAVNSVMQGAVGLESQAGILALDTAAEPAPEVANP